MKKQIKKWALRLTVTVVFIAALLAIIILNPVLTYANKTVHNNYTVYHQQPIGPQLLTRLDNATALLQKSEWYNPSLKLDICLNDGSAYPGLMQKIRGRAFAWGFYDKVVLQGTAHYDSNYVELDGYKWNLTQLLAHEAVHCLQYDHLGFRKTNPVGNIPVWKFEGYPEYIARKEPGQTNLFNNIRQLNETEKANHNGWISFADGTGTVIPYYRNWLLVQYCMDVKKMSYTELLADTLTEESVYREMMNWYKNESSKR
jgi:hypothetical protein